MKTQFELFGTPSQLIMDPVHGGIPFFPHEKKVIDHALFQRLRYIVQNDLLCLVFPGATHTRFQHSIGVMHIAGMLFKSMIRSYLIDSRNTSQAKITVKQAEAIQYFYYCLRLAALLHDTGHTPFSHQLESSEEIKRIFKDTATFEKLWDKEEWKEYYNKPPRGLSHEHYSVRCAHQILRDIPLTTVCSIEPIDVLGILETTNCKPSTKFVDASMALLSLFVLDKADAELITKKKATKIFQTLFKTIISGELDVDKMDYLLRDSYFSGCKYGVYNLDHLLSTIRVGFDLKEPWIGLAISKKGLGALEDFVNSRFQLYLNLYNHKSVVGFKWLLKHAISELMNDATILSFTQKALTDVTAFQGFTDTFFWERIRIKATKKSDSAAGRLYQRKKLKYLHSEKDLSAFKKRQIRTKLSKDGCKVTTWECESKFSKISKTYESGNLRLLIRDPFTGQRELDEIKRHSSFFDKFEDTIVTHFYENPL